MGETQKFKSHKTTHKPTDETIRKYKRQKTPNSHADFALSQTSREVLEPFVRTCLKLHLLTSKSLL